MKKKISLSLFVLFLALFVNVSDIYALNVNDLYGNVTSSSSASNDLLNYAIQYDTFLNSDYVIFQVDQYEYYIVWSKDLKYSNSKITGSDIEFVRQYRETTGTGYNNYITRYIKGNDSTFTLNLNNYSIISNIGVGFTSENYRIFKFNEFVILFLVLITSILFVILIKTLRRIE